MRVLRPSSKAMAGFFGPGMPGMIDDVAGMAAGAGEAVATAGAGELGKQGIMALLKGLGGRAVSGLFGWPGAMLALGIALGNMGSDRREVQGMASTGPEPSDEDAAKAMAMLGGQGGNTKKGMAQAVMMAQLMKLQERAGQREQDFSPRGTLIPSDQIVYLP